MKTIIFTLTVDEDGDNYAFLDNGEHIVGKSCDEWLFKIIEDNFEYGSHRFEVTFKEVELNGSD